MGRVIPLQLLNMYLVSLRVFWSVIFLSLVFVLGNQLLAIASGLQTLKLHRGHRGGNHPVRNLQTQKVEITSQNHGFCVSMEEIPSCIEITHESLCDGTVEGLRRKDKYAFAVQYHPESSPGPHDSHYLFEEFYKMIEKSKEDLLLDVELEANEQEA